MKAYFLLVIITMTTITFANTENESEVSELVGASINSGLAYKFRLEVNVEKKWKFSDFVQFELSTLSFTARKINDQYRPSIFSFIPLLIVLPSKLFNIESGRNIASVLLTINGCLNASIHKNIFNRHISPYIGINTDWYGDAIVNEIKTGLQLKYKLCRVKIEGSHETFNIGKINSGPYISIMFGVGGMINKYAGD